MSICVLIDCEIDEDIVEDDTDELAFLHVVKFVVTFSLLCPNFDDRIDDLPARHLSHPNLDKTKQNITIIIRQHFTLTSIKITIKHNQIRQDKEECWAMDSLVLKSSKEIHSICLEKRTNSNGLNMD